MQYDFNSVISRKNTGAVKTDAGIAMENLGLNYYDDTISMWVADMDFACAPEIQNRLKNRLDSGVFGYTHITKEYYDSVIGWYKKRYSVDINPKWITYSNGTVNAIKNAIRAFTAPGDNIIIQTPVYFPFADQINSNNRVVLENKLLKDDNNNFTIDFVDFEEKCKTAKMFIFCNPHNPTGNIWGKETIERLIDIASKHNVLVFSDEVHSDIIRCGEKFTSALEMASSDNVIVATAINKTFNLAGLHGTNLVVKNKDLRQQLVSCTGKIEINAFTMEATIAAYSEGECWVDEMRQTLDENFNYLSSFIQEYLPNVKLNIPQATYLAWLDFGAYGMEQSELLRKIADEAHVILEDGMMFGSDSYGFVRMNIACPKHILVEACQRIARLDFLSSK